MIYNIHRKAFASLAALLVSLCLSAQAPTGGMKGTVISRTDRSAIEKAALTLYSGTEVIATAVTDENGTFLMEDCI